MGLLEKEHQERELSWDVKLLLFLMIFFISSCAIVKPNPGIHKVQGGYESISYLKENESSDSIRIYGTVTTYRSKKVPAAEVLFIDSKGNTIQKIYTNHKGRFDTKLKKNRILGNIEIDGNNFGSLSISNVDFGIFNNNMEIKAKLFRYDYSITESDFSKKEDVDQLKREIKEMKERK